MAEKIETTQGIQQWEYKSGCFDDKQATKLGEEGWEAFGYDNGVLVFKRPKPAKKQPATDYGYGR